MIHLYVESRSHNFAVLYELRHNRACNVNWDGKSHPSRCPCIQSIHSGCAGSSLKTLPEHELGASVSVSCIVHFVVQLLYVIDSLCHIQQPYCNGSASPRLSSDTVAANLTKMTCNNPLPAASGLSSGARSVVMQASILMPAKETAVSAVKEICDIQVSAY